MAKIYRVEFISSDGSQKIIQFYKGKCWVVIKQATLDAKEKTKKLEKDWAVNDIQRIK